MTEQAISDPETVDRLTVARAWVLRTGNASTASLARELGTSWRAAEQLMLALQQEGIVTAPGFFRAQRSIAGTGGQRARTDGPARSAPTAIQGEDR